MNSPVLAPTTLRHAVAAAGLAAVLSAGADLSAQPFPKCDREPTPADIEGAKGAHKAAEAHYNKGAYDRAIQSWTDAYGFDCTAHRLLINVGNAYEKLGKLGQAIEAFETYLERAGEGADRTIEDKLANLKARQTQEQATPAPTATATGTSAPPPPPPPPGDDESDGPGVGPWIVVGAGGAVTIVGVVLLVVGTSKVSEADDNCPDRGSCPLGPDGTNYADMGNDGRTLTAIGGVGIGVGVAAIAGGLLWYFLSGDDEAGQPAARSTWVQPLVSPWTTGMSVSGSF